VSKSQFDKLRQRKTEATNVNDAIRLARFFGNTIEDFMGLTNRGAKQQEIIEKLGVLPPEVRDVLIVSINALVADHMKRRG
jgi:predicted XRE-type DNA-binding protein